MRYSIQGVKRNNDAADFLSKSFKKDDQVAKRPRGILWIVGRRFGDSGTSAKIRFQKNTKATVIHL